MFNAEYARILVSCGTQTKMRNPEELFGYMVARASLEGKSEAKFYFGTKQYIYVVNNVETLERNGYNVSFYGSYAKEKLCVIVRW